MHVNPLLLIDKGMFIVVNNNLESHFTCNLHTKLYLKKRKNHILSFPT